MRRALPRAAGALLLLALATPALAEDHASTRAEIQALKQQIQDLTRKLERLEDRMSSRPSETAASVSDDPLAALEAQVETARKKEAPRRNPYTAFNPRISLIGDFVYSNSNVDENPSATDSDGNPKGDENRDRFSLREVELGIQSPIDPWARLDVFLSLPGVLGEFDDNTLVDKAKEQRIEVEEGYISYWRLPMDLKLKAGRFRAEIGKENRIHGPETDALDRPLAVAGFLGNDGLREEGVGLSKSINLGDGFDTQLTVTGQILNGEGGEESLFAGPGSDKPMHLGRLALTREIGDDSTLQVGYSRIKGYHDPQGRLEQRINELDLTYLWRPPKTASYKSLLLQGEYFDASRDLAVPIAGRSSLDEDGFYLKALYGFEKQWAVGVRYDESDPGVLSAEKIKEGAFGPGQDLGFGSRTDGYAAWLTYWNSEFSRFRLQYNRLESNFPRVGGKQDEDIISVQWTWSVGPHGAHKF